MPNWFLPTPLKVVTALRVLIKDGILLKIIIDSTLNLVPPYLIAVIASVVIGIIIGSNATARQIFFPFISAFYSIPDVAWLPFIIILFGFTRQSVWILLFIASFFKMIYNMVGGVRNVNPIWILVAKNLGLKKFQIIFKVIIPGALPNIITAMRIGFGSIWRGVIAAEMLVTGAGGLGKFIWTAQWTFSFDKVFVGTLMIAIIGLTIEILVFKRIEAITLAKWGIIDGEA